ncbi:exosortase A [Dechloromonas denitrificans]|uniref:exosortase A n=1 Tax=Dechloromonas denitrificans TaxID=281362 RepID=UPI001CF85F22|nr:exosortase A [Dechloromonas denitrificans]UCV01927.1 exosortase A [Dechloromonas denitrificans]UCV06261.1 exosortase A [Dechloromonas denitrificans]
MSISARGLTPSWRHAIPLLFALIAWLVFWYWDTVVAMVNVWARSDTYAHAFIVPPITLWLIWRQRTELLAEQPRASLLLALPVALTTFLWLLGELTAVNALTQFALVATLVIATMALLGIRVSKRIAFPLAFLFFSVPFGDFLMPKLMEWTATFTILALRASGIPVYQEGLQFIIPSGRWSVVEACSGIRYIIASVTVGTLFAYLNYVSLRRRLIFIIASVLVPIVANWLRAYMIVMLGHLSGNKLAAGVDHLIYGWVFFGLVIMVMFMIGMRWSEAPKEHHESAVLTGTVQAAPTKTWLAMLGIALLTAAGPLAFIAITKADQANAPNLAQLLPPEGWRETTPITTWQPAYTGQSAENQASYVMDGKAVGLYIGYYRNQDYQHKLVTSTNTLAVSTDKTWAVTTRGALPLKLDGLPPTIRTAELLGKVGTPETRLVVWQWYWINGTLTASDAEAKLLTAISRLRGQGDDSAVIMLYAPREIAAESLPIFAEKARGQINQMLTSTRNQR